MEIDIFLKYAFPAKQNTIQNEAKVITEVGISYVYWKLFVPTKKIKKDRQT